MEESNILVLESREIAGETYLNPRDPKEYRMTLTSNPPGND